MTVDEALERAYTGGEHGAGFCDESDDGDYLFREHVLEALAALEGE